MSLRRHVTELNNLSLSVSAQCNAAVYTLYEGEIAFP